ncbi:MAG: lysophospholipase [Microthrixaceae bacterium]|nr:alpha/beta hydrolase [Microthrixaceae bacterium]MCO5313668.1 lysophospholipase [Microthrixaceae bacterium]HPB46780.1 alpha/beta hydrolase [Microthrixaceae bacterium]
MGHKVETIAYPIVRVEQAAFKDTYGGDEGVVLCESYLLKPVGVDSDTVIVFMHPVGAGAYLPMVRGLAKAGHHVIYCNSHYRADFALIMEKVVLDLGACIRDAKQRLGYAKVVLAGWSGGGSLSLFYQSQAEHPTLTETPAGDPPDLTAADLIPADGIMLLAAHPSRHGTLTLSLDPAVRDESNPDDRDPAFDLYGPDAPQPPYDREWLERYRAAQVARNRRITAWVKAKLAELRASGRDNEEFAFVVHGTMADPAALDGTIDPNDREVGVSFLGDPRVVNNGPVGLARFCTLRSWLSQWSLDDANGDGPRAAATISIPALVIYNSADNICLPQFALDLYDAIGHEDKELHCIDGATHYYLGDDQRPKLAEAVGIITRWLTDHDFGSPATDLE